MEEYEKLKRNKKKKKQENAKFCVIIDNFNFIDFSF